MHLPRWPMCSGTSPWTILAAISPQNHPSLSHLASQPTNTEVGKGLANPYRVIVKRAVPFTLCGGLPTWHTDPPAVLSTAVQDLVAQVRHNVPPVHSSFLLAVFPSLVDDGFSERPGPGGLGSCPKMEMEPPSWGSTVRCWWPRPRCRLGVDAPWWGIWAGPGLMPGLFASETDTVGARS